LGGEQKVCKGEGKREKDQLAGGSEWIEEGVVIKIPKGEERTNKGKLNEDTRPKAGMKT